MSKTNLLLILVGALVLLNLGLLTFLFLGKGPAAHHGPPHEGGPKNYIIEKLHFNEKQVQQYQELIHWHRSSVDARDHEIRESKKQLYSLLTTNNESAKDSIITQINKLQREIEEIHYKHFKDIKELCTKEQQPYFEDLSRELSTLFGHPRK